MMECMPLHPLKQRAKTMHEYVMHEGVLFYGLRCMPDNRYHHPVALYQILFATENYETLLSQLVLLRANLAPSLIPVMRYTPKNAK